LSPVSDGGSSSSRCRFRFPMPQFLAVTASALACLAQHGMFACAVHHSELETPCALRLGEPNQDGVTSDALCRTTSLTQELLSRLRQDTSALHLAIKPACTLRRARLLHVTACLRLPRIALRAPSAGLMSTLADEPSPCAITVRFRVPSSAPFREI
jgi:hypothetical protein